MIMRLRSLPGPAGARERFFSWFLLALVLAGLLIALGLMKGVVPQPSAGAPNPPSAWITYTNKEIGFTLKYPQGWFPHEIKTDQGIVIFKLSTPVDSNLVQSLAPGEVAYLQVYRPERNGRSLEDWARQSAGVPAPLGDFRRGITTLKNGDEALRQGFDTEDERGFTPLTLIQHGDFFYIISGQVFRPAAKSLSEYQTDVDTLKQIIASFEFTP